MSFCHEFLVIWKKRLDWKDKVNFKIHDVTTWLTNNCNTHIVQYLKKKRQPGHEVWSVNRYNMRNIFVKKSYTKCAAETIPRHLSKKSKVYLWINNVKFLTVCFCCMLIRGLSKYSEITLQTTCFYLI